MEANMDLLNPNVSIELNDPPWKIYSRNGILPPQYIGSNAKLNNSTLSEGCSIDGEIENSIIFPGVTVMEGAAVRNSIIMPGVTIEKGSTIEYTIIAATPSWDPMCARESAQSLWYRESIRKSL
jgi:glucose-1-phosphate adenylyltransferase